MLAERKALRFWQVRGSNGSNRNECSYHIKHESGEFCNYVRKYNSRESSEVIELHEFLETGEQWFMQLFP